MWPRLFWSKANSPSAPPNGATFLVLSRTRDEIGVVLFPSTATIVTSLRWRGLGRWIWRPNVTRSCRGFGCFSQWPAVTFRVFFFVRQPYVSIEPKQHDATVFEDVDWSHGCRGAAACWWLVRVKFSWTNKSVQFSTALLGCSLLTVRWKIIRWKHGMKVEKTWRNTTSH